MRYITGRNRLGVVLLLAVPILLAAKAPKTFLTVRAITHDSRINERVSTYTTPENSSTNCSGVGTTVGNTTTATANCQTTSTPARTNQIVRRTMDVQNIVDADGMRYVIVCRANWVGSNCSPMIDGDQFPAEIEGTTMWVAARRGGNQGKLMKVKYRILDIRPIPESR